MIIQNLYNKISYSVTDHFGFSSTNLEIFQSVFIDVVRSGERNRFEKLVVYTGWGTPAGVDFSTSASQIQNATPFNIYFTTHDAFLKGERIQSFLGSQIFIRSDTDDMETYVDAVLLWQLKKVAIGVNDPTNALAIVPYVSEKSQAIAASLVHDAGLVPSFTGPSHTNSWVYSQSPTAGNVVAKGSTVHMVLHTGPVL